MTPERIEKVLERPFAKANLERWREVDFRDLFLFKLVAAMTEDLANDCPAGSLVGDSLTAALIAYLDGGPLQVLEAESRPGPSPQRFARVLEYIEENLGEPLRLADLQREAGDTPDSDQKFDEARREADWDQVMDHIEGGGKVEQ